METFDDIGAAVAPLRAKLERWGAIGTPAFTDLTGAVGTLQFHAKSECMIRQGEPFEAVYILCQGFAYASRTLLGGEQQNVALFVAGDLVNCGAYLLGTAHTAVFALTPTVVAPVMGTIMDGMLDQNPTLVRAFWRNMAADVVMAQEWIIGLGKRSAYARLAHLLCEIFARLKAVGLTSGGTCTFPLTQADLADTLGLSVVHVNRTLQQLRRETLVRVGHGQLEIQNWDALARAGEFDSGYLGLPPVMTAAR